MLKYNPLYDASDQDSLPLLELELCPDGSPLPVHVVLLVVPSVLANLELLPDLPVDLLVVLVKEVLATELAGQLVDLLLQ